MSLHAVQIAISSAADRETIYQMRHAVYAEELGQHTSVRAGGLTDALDGENLYLVARLGGEAAGFISVTPPGGSVRRRGLCRNAGPARPPATRSG